MVGCAQGLSPWGFPCVSLFLCHCHLIAQSELGVQSVNCSLGAVRTGGEASLVLGPLPVPLGVIHWNSVHTEETLPGRPLITVWYSDHWFLPSAGLWTPWESGENWRCPPIRSQICAQLQLLPSLSWCTLLLKKCNRFIKIQFMYHTTRLLKVLDSLIFIRLAELGSHHQNRF